MAIPEASQVRPSSPRELIFIGHPIPPPPPVSNTIAAQIPLNLTLNPTGVPPRNPAQQRNPNPNPPIPAFHLTFDIPVNNAGDDNEPAELFVDRNAIRLGKRPRLDETSEKPPLEGITIEAPVDQIIPPPPGFEPIVVVPRTRNLISSPTLLKPIPRYVRDGFDFRMAGLTIRPLWQPYRPNGGFHAFRPIRRNPRPLVVNHPPRRLSPDSVLPPSRSLVPSVTQIPQARNPRPPIVYTRRVNRQSQAFILSDLPDPTRPHLIAPARFPPHQSRSERYAQELQTITLNSNREVILQVNRLNNRFTRMHEAWRTGNREEIPNEHLPPFGDWFYHQRG